ncbi:MAG TPA: polysaccharide deacetylase family protein, partial [Conexibacter sp.]|nr:polysaccharide deacetylase family protein [Conexibacter sp.]
DGIFSATRDPWRYDSAYEQEKYRQTLSLVPAGVERALELGCAEGVFTQLLAERVQELTAADISPRALARAAARCAGRANVRFEQLDLFEQSLPGGWDLIVCSELLYYADDRGTLSRTAQALVQALAPGGHLLTAHAHVVADEPGSPGFDWDVPFGAATIERALLRTRELELVREVRTAPYRVQLYARRGRRSTLPARLRRVRRARAAPGAMAPEHAGSFLPAGGAVRREPAPASDGPRGGELPILMYHRVAPSGAEATRRWRLHPDQFEAQLRHLRDAGYRSLTFEQWRAASDRRVTLPARSVLITFDDGYADFPAHALPLLRRYGFQATMFVVTDLVGASNAWDERVGERIELMDWPTLLGLREHGVELGSHSSAHRALVSLSAAELAIDLSRSRLRLQERTGEPVRTLCYPFGLNDVGVRAIAGACGFHHAVTTDEWQASFSDELLALPRLEVRGTESLEEFVAQLRG